eukprot:5327004-Alexandrium_andersonii.AAC.1
MQGISCTPGADASAKRTWTTAMSRQFPLSGSPCLSRHRAGLPSSCRSGSVKGHTSGQCGDRPCR